MVSFDRTIKADKRIPAYRQRIGKRARSLFKRRIRPRYLLHKSLLFIQCLLRLIPWSQYKSRTRWLREIRYAAGTRIPVFPREARTGYWSSGRELTFTFRRVALVASYSSTADIDAPLLYYLRELKKSVDAIVFVADNPLLDKELERIKPLVDYAIFERHGQYDFGSYKRAFLLAEKEGLLNEVAELVFCNDSCLGPIRPLNEFFKAFSGSDFSGMTVNQRGYIVGERTIDNGYCPHIQSYFFTLSAKIFKTEWFHDFISGIVCHKSKILVISHYEQGLSRIIMDHGFDMKYWFHPGEDFDRDPTLSRWQELAECGFLLKKSLYLRYGVASSELNPVLKRIGYPFQIEKNGNVTAIDDSLSIEESEI